MRTAGMRTGERQAGSALRDPHVSEPGGQQRARTVTSAAQHARRATAERARPHHAHGVRWQREERADEALQFSCTAGAAQNCACCVTSVVRGGGTLVCRGLWRQRTCHLRHAILLAGCRGDAHRKHADCPALQVRIAVRGDVLGVALHLAARACMGLGLRTEEALDVGAEGALPGTVAWLRAEGPGVHDCGRRHSAAVVRKRLAGDAAASAVPAAVRRRVQS